MEVIYHKIKGRIPVFPHTKKMLEKKGLLMNEKDGKAYEAELQLEREELAKKRADKLKEVIAKNKKVAKEKEEADLKAKKLRDKKAAEADKKRSKKLMATGQEIPEKIVMEKIIHKFKGEIPVFPHTKEMLKKRGLLVKELKDVIKTKEEKAVIQTK